MDARTRMVIEIDALHDLLPALDYYRVLQVDPDCAPDAVGDAFRAESRRLHPDRLSALRDPKAQSQANDVYRLVNEAYRCLKDPEKRARYDLLLAGGTLRMTDDANAAAQADKKADDPEHAATDPNAEKFWKMALRDWKNKSYKSCVTNIKFAINFERENEVFKEWLVKAEKALEDYEATLENNPYKLRIV